jgi:signal transduction histidine kinase
MSATGKRAEDELREANELLESRVAERTRELTETNESLRNEMNARAEVEKQRTGLLQRIVTSQEDERQRIARDIHDQLGQRVTALRLQIASFKDADPEKFDGHIELLMRTCTPTGLGDQFPGMGTSAGRARRSRPSRCGQGISRRMVT